MERRPIFSPHSVRMTSTGRITNSYAPHICQPFKDMIEGMRTDLKKTRYKNFDELYMYCYYVAGTVGLMSVWASLLLYQQILDEIEANDYNHFTRRAYVGKGKKLLALPIAYGRSLLLLPCSLSSK